MAYSKKSNILTFDKLPGLTGARNLNGSLSGKALQAAVEAGGLAKVAIMNKTIFGPAVSSEDDELIEFAHELLESVRPYGLTDIEVVFFTHKLDKVFIVWDEPYTEEEYETIVPCAHCPDALNCTEKDSAFKVSYTPWLSRDTNNIDPVTIPGSFFLRMERRFYLILHADKDYPTLYNIVQDNRVELDTKTAMAEGYQLSGLKYFPDRGEIMFCPELTCRFDFIDAHKFRPVLIKDGRMTLPLSPVSVSPKGSRGGMVGRIDAFMDGFSDVTKLAEAFRPLLDDSEILCTDKDKLHIRRI
jgi:hypothetical protein